MNDIEAAFKMQSGLRILDMTAGGRAIWFNKDYPGAVFLDKRAEVKPTFVTDSTKTALADGHFDLVVFDPPHENTGANSNMSKFYGHSTRAEIIAFIEGSGREAHRVSRDNALMAFKWNDHAFNLDKVLALLDKYWEPLFGHHLRNRGGSSAKSQSFWVMLRRRS